MNGWVSTEEDTLDLIDGRIFRKFWPKPLVTHFLAEHVWEHLTEGEALIALENCARVLKPGGRLRIAVPDGRHPSPDYIDYVRPGGSGAGAEDHKVLYTVETLRGRIREAGLIPRPLEWWDDQGKFHKEPWDVADGMVSRSADHDERNLAGPLIYTSLIVDAIKPA